jgi:signal transduction histidine kinase
MVSSPGVSPGGSPGRLFRPPLLYGLSLRQWVAIDVVAAVAVMVAAIFNLHPPRGQFSRAPHGAGELAVLGVACAAVMFRRRWPRSALAVVTAGLAGLTALGRSPFVLDVLIVLVAYMVGARLDRRWSVPAIVVAELVLLAGVATGVARGVASGEGTSLLAAAGAWFAGDALRVRHAYAAGLVEQADQRRLAEVQRERLAVRAERVRIARELHDVVAHSLTVMTVQAGVGRRVMDQQPEAARSALEAIEVTGRTAQDELQPVLRLLRDDPEDEVARGELAPAPGLADLTELAETVQAAGVSVRLTVTGAAAGLSPAMELSVYRIVQEALTNVVKHAPGARAVVTLACSGDEIRVEITDDGAGVGGAGAVAGSAAEEGFRHGVLGMRERVAAFGGSLVAERRPGGGFLVVARFPRPGAAT